MNKKRQIHSKLLLSDIAAFFRPINPVHFWHYFSFDEIFLKENLATRCGFDVICSTFNAWTMYEKGIVQDGKIVVQKT